MRRISWHLERIDLRSKWRWWLRRGIQVSLRHAHISTGIGWLADVSYSAFTPPLLLAAMRTRAELYIAHYPAALPAAAAAARRHGALYAYDAEDFHLGDWPDDPAYALEKQLVRSIEARYLPGCAYVTAASPGIADAYCKAFDIDRPRVILNVFPLSHAAYADAEGNSRARPVSLLVLSDDRTGARTGVRNPRSWIGADASASLSPWYARCRL